MTVNFLFTRLTLTVDEGSNGKVELSSIVVQLNNFLHFKVFSPSTGNDNKMSIVVTSNSMTNLLPFLSFVSIRLKNIRNCLKTTVSLCPSRTCTVGVLEYTIIVTIVMDMVAKKATITFNAKTIPSWCLWLKTGLMLDIGVYVECLVFGQF